MAIKYSVRYPANSTPPDAAYTYGSAKNSTVPGAKNGSPFEKDYINDNLGFQQALLDEAGIVPSGTPDTAADSQYLEALNLIKITPVLTVAAMTADPNAVAGMRYKTDENTVDDGGGGEYITIAGTGTANGDNRIAHDTKSLTHVLVELIGRTQADQNGATGDGITSDSGAIIAANASQGAEVTAGSGTVLPAGPTVRLESKTYATDATLALSRFSALSSLDEQLWSPSRLLWTGVVSSTMITTQSNQTYKNVTIDGDDITGTVGIEWGSDANFLGYLSSEKMRFQRCDVGAKILNCFDTQFKDTRFSNNRLGVEIDPGAGPGGFITTLRFSRCYITDNTEEGIIDKSAVKPQMLCIGDNTIIEKNGDATHPQVKLNEGQVHSINEVYFEDVTNTVTSIEIQDGYIQNAYFNGYSTGIDLGSSSSSMLLDNIKFAGGTGPSVTSSGGALAHYCHMRRCDFSGAPTLDSRIQIFDGCLGDMPAGIPEHAWVMTGAKPQWGLGTTPAILRDIEAHLEADAGTTVNAGTAYRFNITIPVGRMADGKTDLTITPQADLPVNLSSSVARVSTTVARVSISNPTVGNIVLPANNYLLKMIQFDIINT